MQQFHTLHARSSALNHFSVCYVQTWQETLNANSTTVLHQNVSVEKKSNYYGEGLQTNLQFIASFLIFLDIWGLLMQRYS